MWQPARACPHDVARVLRVSRAGGPGISPDGRRVAFVGDVAGTPQTCAAALPGGWPEQLSFARDRAGPVASSPVAARVDVAAVCDGDERLPRWLVSAHGEEKRPRTHVEYLRGLLPVVHAESGLRLPIPESEQAVATLQARRVPVELRRPPDEGHGIASPACRSRPHPAIAAFVGHHLGG